MKVLIDIGHPGHVHLFRPFAQKMVDNGHAVLFTCREKEFETDLLRDAGFDFVSFGRKYSGRAGKIYGLLKFDVLELIAATKFKPDLFLSHGSPYAAHASWLLQKPHISFEDTFNFEQIRLYKPFTETILTSDYDHPLKSDKIISYAGYHELAYLHPNQFEPEISVLDELGVTDSEKYVIVRFVSWNATHDFGHKGLMLQNKIKAVEAFSEYARVFISSESGIPAELEEYKLSIAPHRIHHALAFATLLYGESATMSEEAAMLGVPSIFLFNNSTCYTKHLERDYNLLYNMSESGEDQEKSISRGVEILKNEHIKQEWEKRRKKMLASKIDVTSFMVWFVENWPESRTIMKENPNYQYNFR